MELTLTASDSLPGFTVVGVDGDLDVYTVPRLRELLAEVSEQSRPRVVLDLSGLSFIDSTGVGVLVGALKRIRASDGDLWLVCTRPGILRVFEVTGLLSVFDIVATLDDVRGARAAAY